MSENLYIAELTLHIQPFKAVDDEDVQNKLNAYIDRLAEVQDEILAWPEVSWNIEKAPEDY